MANKSEVKNLKTISNESLPNDYRSSFSSDSDVTRDFGSFTSIPLSIASNTEAIVPFNCDKMEECSNRPPGPVIGAICVQSATDITFGNKLIYKGPVTIEKVTVDKSSEKRE